MPEPIADNPACWSWPEDVRERLAAKRAGIEAVRQADSEAQAATMPSIWSDWLKRMREQGQASDEPEISHEFYGV